MAIFLGGATAVALIHLQAALEMTHDIVESANQINKNENRLTFAHRWGEIAYDPHDPEQRRLMVERIGNLMRNYLRDPLDPVARGNELLFRISLFASAYPFPNWVEDGETVPIRDVAEARQWRDDIKPLLHSLLWSAQVYPERVLEAVDALDADIRARGVLGEPDRCRQCMAGFIALLQAANQTQAEVTTKLEQKRRYEGQAPDRRVVLGGLLWATVVFVSGVIVPMLWETPHRLFVAWIPAAFYVTALAGLFVVVARQPPRRRERTPPGP